MRKRDFLSLSFKTIRARFAAVYVLLAALGTCCIYFSGAICYEVREEQAAPCELVVTASSGQRLAEKAVQELGAISDVLAATGVIEIPVKLTTGDYEAALTLVGISGDYLEVDYDQGGVFPEGSVMPWIVLSEESMKAFQDITDDSQRGRTEAVSLEWLEAEFVLSAGEERLISKVCGIYESGEGLASGYMDLLLAKDMQQRQGQSGEYASVRLRIKNIGVEREVTKQVEALGYVISNPNTTLQERWDVLIKEAVYLLLLGVAILYSASSQQYVEGERERISQRPQLESMRWMGMTDGMLRGIKGIQGLLLNAVGTAVGMGGGYLIPQLLSDMLKRDSVFVFVLPPGGAVICWLMCGMILLVLRMLFKLS